MSAKRKGTGRFTDMTEARRAPQFQGLQTAWNRAVDTMIWLWEENRKAQRKIARLETRNAKY